MAQEILPWPLYKGSGQRWLSILKQSDSEGGGRDSHRYQNPPPTWQQQRGSPLMPPTPGQGERITCGRLESRPHLASKEVRSVGLDTADHAEVVEAKEAAASEGQVEHNDGDW